MGSSFGRNVLGAAFSVAMLSACAGSGTGGVPNAASPLGAAQNSFGQQTSSIAFSGEYVGRFHEKGHGGSRLNLILSQSQNALGGALVSAKGSQGFGAAIAWVANGNTISGNASAVAGELCTFSMSGTYKYRRLTGTYSATYGCPGQTGTFSLWHKCYFQGTGSAAIRPEAGLKPC